MVSWTLECWHAYPTPPGPIENTRLHACDSHTLLLMNMLLHPLVYSSSRSSLGHTWMDIGKLTRPFHFKLVDSRLGNLRVRFTAQT